MAQRVAGDLYYELDGQLAEIKRQLRQASGYPFDPLALKYHLQFAIEGKFDGVVLSAPAVIEVPALLEPVGTITIPALAGRFSVREKFVLNYGRKAKPGVRIAYLGDNFRSWFGDCVEEPVAEASLNYARLTRASLDGPILASFDNRLDLAVLLRQIYWLMEQQPNGEPGTLLTSGWANIFYLSGLTRVVSVLWRAGHGGWLVGADSVTDPLRWFDGFRVFASNSLAPVAV